MSCIVIGETGAGKSTFVNMLTNFFKNRDLNNLKIVIQTMHHKQTEKGYTSTLNLMYQSVLKKSSTDNCTSYTYIDKKSGRKFEIIDTPGPADTRGAAQDQQNIDQILKAAEDAKALSAVVLVMNGANPRYTQASCCGMCHDAGLASFYTVMRIDFNSFSYLCRLFRDVWTSVQIFSKK